MYETVQDFLFNTLQPDDVILYGGLLLLFVPFIWGIHFLRNHRQLLRRLRVWEKTMTGTERTAHTDKLIANKIVDLLEELVHDGHISPQERDKYYKRIGEGACLLDLLPRKLKLKKKDQIELKKQIKARIVDVDAKLKELPSRKVSVRGMKDRLLKAVKAA